MEVTSHNLACLVLQACLVCHQWYLYVFVVVTLVLFGYKGAMLPYPPTGALTWDLIFLALYYVIETTRLFQASKGNRTSQVGPLVLSMALAIPALVCNVYYLQLQTYVLRLDQVLNGITVAAISIEVFVSILALLLLLGKHSV